MPERTLETSQQQTNEPELAQPLLITLQLNCHWISILSKPKLPLYFNFVKTMSSAQLTNRLLGMSACNNVTTSLTTIVILGGSTLWIELVTYHNGGGALWIKWFHFQKLSNVTCCTQTRFAPSTNFFINYLKFYRSYRVAAKNFLWACQISQEWHSRIPHFFLAWNFRFIVLGLGSHALFSTLWLMELR